MNARNARVGRVAVIGAGPAGMAAALSIGQAGHDVVVYERYREARPAGNILNLWPPPIKALQLMGVDTTDLGAPCYTQFRNHKGKVRVSVDLPDDVTEAYGGGFIGMLRPQLYSRLLEAIPEGTIQFNRNLKGFEQDDSGVRLRFDDGTDDMVDVLVGADGIDSMVRRALWGDVPKREHNLHIFGGFTFDETIGAEHGRCMIQHNRDTQGSWTSILHEGRRGYQWWTLTAHDASKEFDGDYHAEAKRLGAGFPDPLPKIIASTEPGNVQRWVLRDLGHLEQWSKGRVTIVGDAAHATSPYAAYGAGMATEDGYFLGRKLAGLDLSDAAAVASALQAFEEPRKPHTRTQVEMAYRLGKIFHHLPRPLRPVRDFVLDNTPFLQKQVGEKSPGEILAQLEEIDRAEALFERTAKP